MPSVGATINNTSSGSLELMPPQKRALTSAWRDYGPIPKPSFQEFMSFFTDLPLDRVQTWFKERTDQERVEKTRQNKARRIASSKNRPRPNKAYSAQKTAMPTKSPQVSKSVASTPSKARKASSPLAPSTTTGPEVVTKRRKLSAASEEKEGSVSARSNARKASSALVSLTAGPQKTTKRRKLSATADVDKKPPRS